MSKRTYFFVRSRYFQKIPQHIDHLVIIAGREVK